MIYKLVDPSYCVTVDLTYHKQAIRDGIKAINPNAIINIHRFYFEVEETPDIDYLDLYQLSTEISKRDTYLNSLYKPYPIKKKTGEVLVKPLLFKLVTY